MKYVKAQQFLVVTGLITCSFSDGFIFGQLSGMVDALRGKNNTIKLDDDDISWIASTINITCFFGFAVMTALTELFGRRKTITIITMPMIITWLMVYFAKNKFILLASRIIVGVCYGGLTLLVYINIGEYTPPNIRSLILNIVTSAGASAGTMTGHILSIFLNWRNVALIGLIPTAISAIFPLFWVESPSWLASKGRFEECEISFKSLHVRNQFTDKELKMLIESEKIKIQNSSTKTNFMSMVKKFIAAFKYKYFWKISILNHVIGIYRVAAGRVLFNTFAITMIQDITGSSNILLFTLLIDGFALLGSAISCILVIKFKMRSLLFTSGLLANTIQVITAISLYSLPKNNSYIVWINILLLALYFITVTAGPYAVVETIMTEIQPLEIKAINVLYVGSVAGIIQFLSIKLAPDMFRTIGYHGVFLLNSVIIFLCLLYFYKYLPETKGRTLQEIESYFKYNTFKIVTDTQTSEAEKENILRNVQDENVP